MEIRTYEYTYAKEMGRALHIPYAASGVFVDSANTLLRAIKYLRIKEWKTPFGVQPRRYSINRYGSLSLGGTDTNVYSIKYIFIDIDRKIKISPATSIELRDCNIIADMILERFKKHRWSESYIKICSGNGVQLFIKLDIAIKMPMMDCRNIGNRYVSVPTERFEKIKQGLLLIGKDIRRFVETKKRRAGIENVEIDMSCFRIAQAGALPFTKNYKYGGFTWRGIVEMKDGCNNGISDYFLSFEESIKERKRALAARPQVIDSELRCIPGKLRENKLIRWFLDNDFPGGGINNTIWFEIKIMLRDNKIDFTDSEVQEIRQELGYKHGGRAFTINIPEDKYSFNVATVNNYCIRNFMEPIFELWPEHKIKDKRLIKFDWNLVDYFESLYVEGEDILDIFREMKNKIKDSQDCNTMMISMWKGLKERYGEYKARWWFEHCYERFFIFSEKIYIKIDSDGSI